MKSIQAFTWEDGHRGWGDGKWWDLSGIIWKLWEKEPEENFKYWKNKVSEI